MTDGLAAAVAAGAEGAAVLDEAPPPPQPDTTVRPSSKTDVFQYRARIPLSFRVAIESGGRWSKTNTSTYRRTIKEFLRLDLTSAVRGYGNGSHAGAGPFRAPTCRITVE